MNISSAFIRARRGESGIFIIEAIISLLLFAIALVGLIALSGKAIHQVGQSKARNDAAFLVGELFTEMWISTSINLATPTAPTPTYGPWETRLRTLIPNASGAVYLSSCDCITSATNACSGRSTGTITIASGQAVTVCVTWADAKEATGTTRLYQASTMITRNL